MAFLQCSFNSKVLGHTTALNVILPERNSFEEPGRLDSEGKFPVLYLLHGYSDDHTMWMRKSAIERYAQEHQIAVVMPDGGKAFYTDMAYGDDYFTYISEEVREVVTQWFPISKQKAFNYIAGLSMGGYGAMKIALTHPERYAAAATLSGAVDMATQVMAVLANGLDFVKKSAPRFDLIYGDLDKVKGSSNDVFYLASVSKENNQDLPKIYIACGTEDFLYQDNLGFCNHLKGLAIPYEYSVEKADHEWWYWDKHIEKFINTYC